MRPARGASGLVALSLGKKIWRGSHEEALAVKGPEALDADRMGDLVQQVVTSAAEAGNCVIVGRGGPFFLRNRADVFSAFLFAPRAFKIQRVSEFLHDPAEAEHLVEPVDRG